MTLGNELSDIEKEAVDELRERVKNVIDQELYDNIYLFLRFLKARDFNIDNAETMLRKHIQWREKYDLKNALNYKKSDFTTKYFPNHIIGFDKEGCVIRFCPLGTVDFSGFVASLKFEEFVKFILYSNELEGCELKKQSEKRGRNIDKCVYIYDLQNLSFAQITDKRVISHLIFLLNTYLDNYPEKLKAAYVFNVPVFFSIVHSLLKSFLPNTVLNKISIYSDDSYKEDLLKVIDADVLPEFLGGTRTDPDGNPLCLKFLKRGETVPESYHLSKNKRSLAKVPGVQKITLSRAKFHEVTVQVKEAGTYLEWEFETKCRDIGFGLFYQEIVNGEEKITELVPIQRIDTELYPETGTIMCERSGTYVIVFDNTYSWVRSKDIFFRTKLVTPKEYEASKMGE